MSDSTAHIPLYVFTSGDGYKIGINASLDNGTTYRMYEFDTGGTGFWAAYNPTWWANTPAPDAIDVSITYTSSITYQAQVVAEPITFQGTVAGVPTPLTVNSGNVAAIEQASKTSGSGTFDNAQFQADISATPTPIPPIYGNFFGDFGMGLGTSKGLFAILPQLSGNLSSGFIIDLGGYPTSDTPIGGNNYIQVGSVQVGLTQDDINSFPYRITMQGSNSVTPFPGSGLPTYQEVLANGTVGISNSSTSFSSGTGIVFDTGAPTTAIHVGTSITANDLAPFVDANGNLASTSTFSLSSPGTLTPDWLMSFQADGLKGFDQVNTTTIDVLNDTTGYVNSGLQPFFQGRVMFDLADGIIGFAPACFAAGTRIATPDGEANIEALCPGDLVRTASGATHPIKWIGHRRVDCPRHAEPDSVLPIRVMAHAFGPGLPRRDLLLSPDHALFLDGVLVPVKYLRNDTTITQMQVPEITYFHIELDRHDILLAEGLPAESYLDTADRVAFANNPIVSLRPVFDRHVAQPALHWEAVGYAPLVVQGPELERIRAALDIRTSQATSTANLANIAKQSR